MSDFIPNSFQVPNAYVDRFWHLLRPVEKDVLIYLFRRIYGFHGKSCDAVSLRQFTDGIVTADGRRLDHGTGWGKVAVLNGIESLARFGLVQILAAAVKYPPSKRKAAVYGLQLDASLVDIAGLEDRATNRGRSDRQRVSAANEQKEVMRFVGRTSPCGSSDEPTTTKYLPSNRERRRVTGNSYSNREMGDDDPTFDFPKSLLDIMDQQ